MALSTNGLIVTPTSTKTGAATLADGFKSVNQIRAALDAATGGELIDGKVLIPLGTSGQGRRDRSAALMFASTEANNVAVTAKIRLLYGGPSFNPQTPSDTDACEVRLLGTATLTIGQATGVASNELVTDSYRFADTISWSGSAYATILQALLDVPSIDSLKHSPADDTIAILNLPDCDDAAAILVEFVNTNASKVSLCLARVYT